MKQLFLIAAIVLASVTANAQCDSALGKVPGAILLQPKVVNYITKDTATQLTWSVFDLSRDTTKGCNSYVALYDRNCKTVYQLNIAIPASTVNKWGTNDAVIDDFILSFLGLFKKQ